MGYYEYSKAYQLFYFVKWQIIIISNVLFDENYCGVEFLNASSILIHEYYFYFVSDTGSPIPFFNPLIGKSNFLPVPTRPLTSESTSLSSLFF